jgi:hypothetical protein
MRTEEDKGDKHSILCFKKFLTGFLNMYLAEQKDILKTQHLAFNYVTECLTTISRDAKLISDAISIRQFSFMDRACEIAENTI